jgi:23S rRNA pseudouridine1911/1915/1917 synthase
MPRLDVLYEDNHLLVVNKPAGLATMGVADDEPSLVQQARQYLKQRYHKPGNVYLGVVSRLDAWVSGVIVLARTSKAAGRLAEQFRGRRVRKLYWALVERPIEPPGGQWEDWLAKDDVAGRMVVARSPGAKLAKLQYRVLHSTPQATLVEIELETGRKHQIRVQLASRGYSILGDRKYGSGRDFDQRAIALHARRLELEHPVRREPLAWTAPVPESWRRFGVAD